MDAQKKIGNIPKRQNITTGIMCVAGIALNLILYSIVETLELPLYLNTVGTVSVAALGGYLPGILVGFLTNVISSISDPNSLYYGFLNVLIAVCAAYMAKHGWFERIRGIIGAGIVFALIGGGAGAFIPWFLDDIVIDGGIGAVIYGTGHFSPAVSNLLSCLIADLADKAITVIVVAGLLHILPGWLHSFCGFNIWMQNPDSVHTENEKDGTYTRAMSLRTKVLLMLIFTFTVVVVAISVISMSVYRKSVVSEYAHLAQGTATAAASIIDGDMVNEYLETAGDAPGYDETMNMLTTIRSGTEDLEYLYAYKIQEDGCHVVFDVDTEEAEGSVTGSVEPFDPGFSEYIPALLRGDKIDPIITNDSYGYLLTVYQPVYDSNNNTVCYVGADVDMGNLIAEERSFLMEMLSILIGFFILLGSFVMWLTDYNIIYPLKAVTAEADTNSNIADSQDKIDDNVREIRRIDIHTGDELEALYNSFCQMTLNQAEQLRNIRRLSNSTVRMQDGLIITMADMVENRDSDTGAHIQKTAAYVKIIVEGLKRKGYYAEKITPKFMSDVVRSAPLHDVGKINIPDEVLNKPGKLTDEEFEIMKTHTTAGKRIMEHAISTVEGDNYLKEARNMAAYHHERWDGKGYPEGLHGEVIPLAARIMAVADVFDALTSPRVYKPAFPFEKALSIIEEGRGTQFDPKCIEVFMESLDEVKVILRKYNNQEM